MNYFSFFRHNLGPFIYIIPLLQILTAVHIIKTGRSWSWLWLVIVFPVIGFTIYFIVEIMPGYQKSSFSDLLEKLVNFLKPGSELKKLKEKIELCDSVENRKALADYYMRKSEPFKAAEIYKSCLQGAYKGDDFLTLFLCQSLYEAKLFAEAMTNLAKLRKDSPNYEKSKVDLLFAKLYEAEDDIPRAFKIYEDLALKYGEGEEPRCRLALLLEKTGDLPRAISIHKDIIKRSKKFFPNYRRTEKEWIVTSRIALKRLKK